MSAPTIREATEADRAAIFELVARAFGRDAEAALVEAIVADSEDVLELVAVSDGAIVGHVLFSRLSVESGNRSASAVALAPISVDPARQRSGIGSVLVEEAHRLLRQAGETLSVVLGEPTYYGRFGYAHARAAGFSSEWQCEELQALAWGDAPTRGRLVYPAAFGGV